MASDDEMLSSMLGSSDPPLCNSRCHLSLALHVDKRVAEPAASRGIALGFSGWLSRQKRTLFPAYLQFRLVAGTVVS